MNDQANPVRPDCTQGKETRVAERHTIAWSEATWLNPPLNVEADGDHLLVTTRDKSDFWRTTSYGFIRADGHALLTDFPVGTAVEVSFVARLDELYDQAGAMVWVDEKTWIKTGVEMADGAPHLGAVVTHGLSDWSQAPVPEWAGREVTVRVSRAGDALTIRARCQDGPWRMLRLAPLSPDAAASAGPFCCSPQREGLRISFTRFVLGPADTQLHGDPEA
jgi:regulation of enolase protein 1 (concanavalin A-like superfamily)